MGTSDLQEVGGSEVWVTLGLGAGILNGQQPCETEPFACGI